jgi:hypothetical protein
MDAEVLQSRMLDDDVLIDYARTGVERPRTWLGHWLQRGTPTMSSGAAATQTEVRG